MKPVKNESGLYEVIIDERKYEFEKWGAEDSTDTILDIAAIAGKPIGLGIATIFKKDDVEGKKGLDKAFDPDVVGMILESLSERVGTNKSIIKALIKKLSSDKVLCDGAKIQFNTHYQDCLDHLFRVVRAALEVQYGNFFAAFLALQPGSPAKAINKAIQNRGRQT